MSSDAYVANLVPNSFAGIRKSNNAAVRFWKDIPGNRAYGGVGQFHDGIHLDFRKGYKRGHYVKVPGKKPTIAAFNTLFTFTGDNKSMYRGASGLLVSSATNTPRIEYDLGGNVLGLLAEGARTNLCLQSADIATTWANNRSSDSTNTVAAPDGTTTADTLIEDNTNGQHYVSQNITVAASALTVSAFFKAKERSFAVLSFNDGSTECTARYDLSAGTVGTVDATLSGAGSIRAFANGWYRCILTVTAAGTSGNLKLGMTTTSSGFGYQGDNASGIYVWGTQLEQASFPSSYIPTTTGSVARAADVASRTFGSEFLTTVGTAYAEFVPSANLTTAAAGILAVDANGVILRTNTMPTVSIHDGTNTVTTATGPTVNVVNKVASSYGSSALAACVNGGAVATGSFDGSMGAASAVVLGQVGSGASPLFGHIRRLSYFPERKSNTFLQWITT